ncbi:MarR family winged helix-turn-helix transcriptional regulator [Agrobacterium radiobacter]|jgi:DNA-binding MarR family transcriptional regulator|uniref:Organic hydroperoxide resistance transcriptional regulator, MarR family n=1 Tax=Agrobacterium tumefaciens str. B6 TaxID=1183423 RepID=A0A822V3D4_AGRTU|nr:MULTISPECIES: MarR family transcriptional regulator [Agrobacterium tumefaciens complex]AYM04722.1 MarR family transcriptional regulator [Agrobacterium tumefaciens]KWT86145.1 MarR family transcriptional regulator [Agrobacterium tumefaciens str. B6]MBB4405136.1 DNA-binding MarR family transcriptional regulator [Agrobacterium radiobacter]MBB4451456.1 DNA-binding MarR family transcriptional regulator [Agrobacterium radiobacter]MDR6589346.1 DNA-binding MarR family transcriptional regulator [Agro
MDAEGDEKKMESLLRLDQQICFALYGAAHAFTRAYKPLLDPIGLTYPQYLVMMALWEKETSTVKALGEMLGLDSGTLSPLLKRLEHAGLITRKRGTVDERQVLVALTHKGANLKKEGVKIMAAIGSATGCGLEELVQIRDRVNALKDSLTRP